MGTESDQFGKGMNTERSSQSNSVGISIQELVNSFYSDVYRFAYRLSGNQADAEDLTQQTFLTACRKLHQIKDLSKSRSWLFTIVRNAFLKTQRHPEIELSTFEDMVVAVDAPTVLNLEFDEEALGIALGEMPETYRTPVLLYYFEEIGYKEIAEILQVPIGTVMSRLSRGKQFLRSKLSPESP
ncbi:ECF RNA polymerase sigma factor SigE [Thalassoglobus polymorphus]|uniref:ECF RNA polymerase sigma factor SigE n=2 Tax=Thalassoglobus polymorphus TaxID=2527994 RepID=A0A517QPA6_9PLAN|nr:ECF RNA polymerase sigma factor SigE [Thalassoglobus polymorphus]